MEPLEIVERFGLPGAALLGLWILARQIADRLLNKADGILTRVANRHIEFVDKLEETQTNIGNAAEIASQQLIVMNASRDRLISAASYACDILEHVSVSLEIEEQTKGPLEAMRRELMNYTH